MSKLEVITNLYSNKLSFCNGFLHKFHKSQFFFFNYKNHLKKQAQVPQITVLLFRPQELFKETGYALDVPSMAGSSRTGLWITIILDRSWSCGPFLSQHSDHNNAHHHPDVDALDASQVETQDGYDLVFWQQISTFHQHFCHIFQMDNCWAWMMFVFVFLQMHASNFSVFCSKIKLDCDIFLSFGIFGFQCKSVLFCMIIALLKQVLCSIKFWWRRWC